MANREINWAAVFIAYCRGASEEEICAQFTVSEQTLHRRMYEERWPNMRNNLIETFIAQAGTIVDPDLVPDKGGEMLAAVLANREKNYEQAARLRDAANDMLERVEISIRGPKGEEDEDATEIRALDVESGAKIANTLKAVASSIAIAQDLTYRSLGDIKPAEGGPSKGEGGGTKPIIVNLPAAISRPRSQRLIEAQVIEQN